MSFDIHWGGGRSGSMLIVGFPFSPFRLMWATLKPLPHWLHVLLPRHLSTKTSSGSFRFTTRSMSVTSPSISWNQKTTENIIYFARIWLIDVWVYLQLVSWFEESHREWNLIHLWLHQPQVSSTIGLLWSHQTQAFLGLQSLIAAPK